MRNARMGAGPERLLGGGLVERLASEGHDVAATTITLPDDAFLPEVQAAFELNRRLASSVAAAIANGAFPLVIAGNCITSVGTVSGVGEPELGVIWFDAHGDFNTPETTRGGFLDGMALAVLTGRCWQSVAGTVPGFRPVSEDRVVMFGTRHLDPAEEAMLSQSGIERVPVASTLSGAGTVMAWPRSRMHDVYVHIDLDSLDPSEGKANGYATDGGLRLSGVRELVAEIGREFRVRAAAITAYDPSFDTDGRMCEAGIGLILTLADSVEANISRGLNNEKRAAGGQHFG